MRIVKQFLTLYISLIKVEKKNFYVHYGPFKGDVSKLVTVRYILVVGPEPTTPTHILASKYKQLNH